MKVYTKVTSGMEMTMARGRFLGAVAKCVSISPWAGVWRMGPRDPSEGAALSLHLLGLLGALGRVRGRTAVSLPPPSPTWTASWWEEGQIGEGPQQTLRSTSNVST